MVGKVLRRIVDDVRDVERVSINIIGARDKCILVVAVSRVNIDGGASDIFIAAGIGFRDVGGGDGEDGEVIETAWGVLGVITLTIRTDVKAEEAHVDIFIDEVFGVGEGGLDLLGEASVLIGLDDEIEHKVSILVA